MFAAAVAGNEILIHLQQQVHQLWTQAWRKFGYVPEKKEKLHEEHVAMVAALENGDNHLLLQLIEEHVNKEIE